MVELLSTSMDQDELLSVSRSVDSIAFVEDVAVLACLVLGCLLRLETCVGRWGLGSGCLNCMVDLYR